ncbi:MAG: hypothetical protein JW709_06290 [Sedimentisphaerales bacterium]|nr:hypothetical protein [Sedimentisphaerales bacterium]
MNKTYLIIIAVVAFTSLLWGQAEVPLVASSADAPQEGILELPTAQAASVDNLVPPQTIRQLANHTARQQWGRTILISEIPCCDAEGQVTAYMMVYQIGGERARPATEILTEVREGREKYKQAVENLERYRPLLEQEFRQARREKHQQQMAAEARGETLTPETVPKPVAFDPPEQYRRAYDEFNEARKQRWGTGHFGYLLVSARYDQNPVRVRGNGLPYYFSQGDLIQERAQEVLQSRPTLKRIFMKTPLDQWYEFEGEDGSAVLINPFTKEKHETGELPTLMSDSREAPQVGATGAVDQAADQAQQQKLARAQYFQEKWMRLIAEAEGGEPQ